MGKGRKNRKSKNKKSATAEFEQSGFANAVRANAEAFRDNNINEAFASMDQMDRLSLPEQKIMIRQNLRKLGTDLSKNDIDPTGNGDQSPITTSAGRQAARDMYAIGGDLHAHASQGSLSQMAFMCAVGQLKAVQQLINDVTSRCEQPWSRQVEMRQLLETRETSLRLSPLGLIVSLGKNFMPPGPGGNGDGTMNHVGVAKLLLKYGASPDAKDALGKTVCHYGAGGFATSMTMDVVDMCIRAAQTSYLHGKDVELHSLKRTEMNGGKGVVGGFDADTGRRCVYLLTTKKEVWVKPENIRLSSSEDTSNDVPMLADVQDRMGSVSLHEVIMQGREDVGQFLLEKHDTSIDTKDMDGMTPLMMSSGPGMLSSAVSKIVMAAAQKRGSQSRKEKKQALRTCAWCKKEGSKNEVLPCAACTLTFYCGRECQKAHWKNGHKAECAEIKNLSKGVKLQPPRTTNMAFASMSMLSGTVNRNGSYRNPTGVAVNEKFVIKVQGGSEYTPIMVYDESRTCQFSIDPGQPGFIEVLDEMRKEACWGGRKTFMKASFDESGDCTVYPATAGVKSKYTW